MAKEIVETRKVSDDGLSASRRFIARAFEGLREPVSDLTQVQALLQSADDRLLDLQQKLRMPNPEPRVGDGSK